MLNTPIEFLKGVTPLRGDMLRKELRIFTYGDLLFYYPFRHIDRTKITPIAALTPSMDYVQIKGHFVFSELIASGRKKRLVAKLRDAQGDIIELVWFQGLHWVEKMIDRKDDFLVFGKLSFFNGSPQISHPELELVEAHTARGRTYLEPIYFTTEKLKSRGLKTKQIAELVFNLLISLSPHDVEENIPLSICQKWKLISRFEALKKIHFPKTQEDYNAAIRRLKFEEFFIAQVRLNLVRIGRNHHSKGILFEKVGTIFNTFYKDYLPFELTNAQKKVLKEIRQDTAKGHQMNRLVQGDVGSGKTIVALLSMLLAIDNGYQACMMAPTEILATQHYNGLQVLLENLTAVKIGLLTGSVKGKARKQILQQVQDGEIQILVGTHALIEDTVTFHNLGLAIVDEQHRFGVAQRAKLWKKNIIPPHVLVMTATPIPRTLAMTAYGDLDYSIMDELPPGRQPIKTVHRYETQRIEVMSFLKSEIDKGRQVYVIYPLIEESEKLDYENLMQGYEMVKTHFPEGQYYISMVHGKQSPELKETNMQRFVSGDTQIMVSTTVIEVGVNVPNASVIVIESAEKFGLSQLHQLRGRVGRGSEQSYCILISSTKLSKEARERIKIMCDTNDGFKIAEKDLELRGPGEIDGTKQSGIVDFKLASIVSDKKILDVAKAEAESLVMDDNRLEKKENALLRKFLLLQKGKTNWAKIS